MKSIDEVDDNLAEMVKFLDRHSDQSLCSAVHPDEEEETKVPLAALENMPESSMAMAGAGGNDAKMSDG